MIKVFGMRLGVSILSVKLLIVKILNFVAVQV